MSPTSSSSGEHHVFDSQQSTDDDQVIVAWLRTAVTAGKVNVESIASQIENTADLLKPYVDLPELCEKDISLSRENHRIFLILSDRYASTLLPKVHDLPVVHSVYIHQEVYGGEDLSAYFKVTLFNRSSHSRVHQMLFRLSMWIQI
jgi:hypothetical protein